MNGDKLSSSLIYEQWLTPENRFHLLLIFVFAKAKEDLAHRNKKIRQSAYDFLYGNNPLRPYYCSLLHFNQWQVITYFDLKIELMDAPNPDNAV